MPRKIAYQAGHHAFVPGAQRGEEGQHHVGGELHPDAHGGDQSDRRDGVQLDAEHAHEASQLHRHAHHNDGHHGRGPGVELQENGKMQKIYDLVRKFFFEDPKKKSRPGSGKKSGTKCNQVQEIFFIRACNSMLPG